MLVTMVITLAPAWQNYLASWVLFGIQHLVRHAFLLSRLESTSEFSIEVVPTSTAARAKHS